MSELTAPVISAPRIVPTATQLFVEQTYKTVLSRVPDRAGFDTWVNQIDTGQIQAADLERLFRESEEGQRVQKDLSIVGLYDVILNRAPDPYGFESWSNLLKDGNGNLVDIARAIAQSPEAQKIYTSYENTRDNMEIASRNLSMKPIDQATQSTIDALIDKGNDFADIITRFVIGSAEGPIQNIYEKLLTQNYKHQYGFYKGYGIFDAFVPVTLTEADEAPPLQFNLDGHSFIDATTGAIIINGTTGNDRINPSATTGTYRINALEGNDVIDGSSGGNNLIVAGPGNDVITTHNNDTVFPGWNFKEDRAYAGQSSGGDVITINGSGTFYQSSGSWTSGPGGGNDYVNYNVVGQGKLTFLPIDSHGPGRTNILYNYCTSWGPAERDGYRRSDDTINLSTAANITANQLTFRDTDYYLIKKGQALGITILSFNAASDFFARMVTGGSGIYFEQGNIKEDLIVTNTYNSLYYENQFGVGRGSAPWNPKPNASASTVDSPGEWAFYYVGGGRGDKRDAHLTYFDTTFNRKVNVIFPSDSYEGYVQNGDANNDVNNLEVKVSNDWLAVWS